MTFLYHWVVCDTQKYVYNKCNDDLCVIKSLFYVWWCDITNIFITNGYKAEIKNLNKSCFVLQKCENMVFISFQYLVLVLSCLPYTIILSFFHLSCLPYINMYHTSTNKNNRNIDMHRFVQTTAPTSKMYKITLELNIFSISFDSTITVLHHYPQIIIFLLLQHNFTCTCTKSLDFLLEGKF